MNRIILVLTFLALSACAGGGGSDYTPPKSIQVGQSTPLTMELTAWGAGSGKLSKRYTDIACHFRITGSNSYLSVSMTPIAETPDRLKVQCVVPPLHAKAADTLEYYIDFRYDGVYSKLVEKPLPFE